MEAISLTTSSNLPAGAKPAEPLPDERQLRHWLARGLGLWAEDLEPLGGDRRRGGGRPLFYAADVAGVRLALRRDGLGAYLMAPPIGAPALGEALTMLRERGLQAAADLDQDSVARQRGWLKIAAGAAPDPGRPGRIEWLCADRLQERVSARALRRRSAAMLEFFQRVSQGETGVQGAALVVYPGQLVGRGDPGDRGTPGRDVFGRVMPAPLSTADGPLVPGPFISFDDHGDLRAERFGYLCLRAEVLSVVSPIHLSMVEALPPFIEGQQIRLVPKIKAGEAVARRYLPSPGVAGQDLRGRPLPAPGDLYRPLREGTGVISELAGDLEVEISDLIYPGVNLRLGKTSPSFSTLRRGGKFSSGAEDEPGSA